MSRTCSCVCLKRFRTISHFRVMPTPNLAANRDKKELCWIANNQRQLPIQDASVVRSKVKASGKHNYRFLSENVGIGGQGTENPAVFT